MGIGPPKGGQGRLNFDGAQSFFARLRSSRTRVDARFGVKLAHVHLLPLVSSGFDGGARAPAITLVLARLCCGSIRSLCDDYVRADVVDILLFAGMFTATSPALIPLGGRMRCRRRRRSLGGNDPCFDHARCLFAAFG